MAEFSPSLMSAMEVLDTDVPSDQISRAMQKFVLADVAYSEFFASEATGVLRAKNVSDVKIVAADFLADDDLASKSGVVKWLTALKSTEELQAIHGVGLIKVVAKPSDKSITNGGTFDLPSSDQLRFLITVENQGNMAETDVQSHSGSKGQQRPAPDREHQDTRHQSQGVQGSGDQGRQPNRLRRKGLLKIEVGPVPNEKNLDNNSLEAHVVFVL